MNPARILLSVGLSCVFAASLGAETFLVGPTRAFTQIHQVVDLLGPGDLVLVDGGATYQPVIFPFENDGAPADPVVVRGVRNGAGLEHPLVHPLEPPAEERDTGTCGERARPLLREGAPAR